MSLFQPRVGILIGVAASVASLVAVNTLVTASASGSKSARSGATAQKEYVSACPQHKGPAESIGDLNVRVGSQCAAGQKPFKLALWPVAGTTPKAEYGVAEIFVSRGGARPARFALFSTALGSPAGSTTGGQFRFTCTPAQAPCKISWGAAVISQRTGTSTVFPRITVHKQPNITTAPMSFCEYADGANNNLGVARVQRVPSLRAAGPAMRTPQTMGLGGSFDCGANQPGPTSPATEIWVPADGVNSNFYDVWVTLTFK
jgi:hypothetical protein